jgi:hypothetical protein
VIIVAKACPNNKFQIKRYRIADGYLKARKDADSPFTKEIAYCGEKLAQLQANQKIVSFYFDTEQSKPDVNLCNNSAIAPIPHSEICSTSNQSQFDHCVLPQKIEIYHPESSTSSSWIEHLNYQEFAARNASTLDLLKKSQHPEKKERIWGKKQSKKDFRFEAGQKIRDGGAIIDRFVGKRNSTMLTCTLPGSTSEACDAVARWSGWIVNRMLQVVRRVKDKANPPHWFFVWEHQKRGALHLHFCLGWKTSQAERELLANKLGDKFYECLLEIYNKDNVDCFKRKGFQGTWRYNPNKWQRDVQQVNKSVASYFAKYCKKNARYNGTNEDKSSDRQGDHFVRQTAIASRKTVSYPSRYWGSSRTIKVRIKSITIVAKYDTYAEEDTQILLQSLRVDLLSGFNIKAVTIKDFQIEDSKSRVIWSSGTVETYTFDPIEYTKFWLSRPVLALLKNRASAQFKEEMLASIANYAD